MTAGDVDLVRRAWDAFSRGDVTAAFLRRALGDGKVVEMVVYPTVEDALAAAGLSANT